jgi:acyl-coenzyme A synthetase/AMP-(fatty) acid ligase
MISMQRTRMTNYDGAHAAFGWSLPTHFNFGGDVIDHFAKDPARLALIWCDASGAERRFTFADIRRLSNHFANLLRDHGVAKGDRVVVMLPRIPEWQIAMIGCLKLGAVPIPCITMLTEKDVTYRVDHSAATAVITTVADAVKFDAEAAFKLRCAVGDGTPNGWVSFDDSVAGESQDFNPVHMDIEDPAIMYYTSGSSGDPKGVTHAARSLFAWRVSAWHWLDLDEEDVMWCTADTGWSKAGTSVLFGPWSVGATVLFYDGPFDPRGRFDLLAKYGVTVFCAAATELRRLVLEDISGVDLSALRQTVSAGETVNPDVIERWTALTGTPLLDGYGLTEILMVILNYPALPVKPGSMGKPLPGTDILVIDDDDRPLGAGEIGRLVIRLPHPQLMHGYWNDPDLTASAFVDIDGVRHFITSDVVSVDEDGYVFYQGRADDVINASGYRIGPLEVENALMAHESVQECAAVGSPDADRGEVVKAFVVLNPGFTGDGALVQALQDHAKQLTAPYKYPRKIDFVLDLPKTTTGKIQRGVLRREEYEHGDMNRRTTC